MAADVDSVHDEDAALENWNTHEGDRGNEESERMIRQWSRGRCRCRRLRRRREAESH